MSNHININNNNKMEGRMTKPKVSAYIPKAVVRWLDTGHKLGLLSRKDEYKFVAKYMSLRANNGTVLRKEAGTPDNLDKELVSEIADGKVFTHGEMTERLKKKIPFQTPSTLYHRLQKLVEDGVMEKTSVGGKVLYTRKSVQDKDKQ